LHSSKVGLAQARGESVYLKMKYRQEVVNTELAKILKEYGLTAEPEIITRRKKKPDVLVIVGGLKVILEGDITNNPQKLYEAARKRLEDGLADVSISILYPEGINIAGGLEELKDNLKKSRYSGKIFYWGRQGIEEMPLPENSSIKELVEGINRVCSLYIRNDILSEKVKEINNTIRAVAGELTQTTLLSYAPSLKRRLKEALGISEGEEEEDG